MSMIVIHVHIFLVQSGAIVAACACNNARKGTGGPYLLVYTFTSVIGGGVAEWQNY
jgi:hypothetical protein